MRALVSRLIRGPDGTEYRLVAGADAPPMPAGLAAALERARYVESQPAVVAPPARRPRPKSRKREAR